MDMKSTKVELAEAYGKLARADRQIKNLLKERKQTQMVFELLSTAGFITEGKLKEARSFVGKFYS